MEKVALKTDHQLMDPDFEGYKLSLDSVPIYQQKLDSPLEVRTANDDQVKVQILFIKCNPNIEHNLTCFEGP